MKGDFSRNTFNPKKNYHSVRMQQGRVLLDADWNEMVDIINHQHGSALHNLIGEHGGLGNGFKVTFGSSATEWSGEIGDEEERTLPRLFIHAGQYYAHGFSCTLAETISLENQPYFPGAAEHIRAALIDQDAEQWLVYLEVWERHLTAIEDPGLVEPSLGGRDTATRTQMVWQVKMLQLENRPVNQKELAELPEWQDLVSSQTISIKINQGYAPENELFRIEIHAGNKDPQRGGAGDLESFKSAMKPASWKWSRDNGTIAFPLQGIELAETSEGIKDHHRLELVLAADQQLQDQLQQGNCVEVDCDQWVLNGRSGLLGRISQVEAPGDNGQQRLLITISQPVIDSDDLRLLRDPDEHPLVRRWDQRAKRDNGEPGDFYLYQVTSIPVSPSNLEITVPQEQPSLYEDDWVDLSVDGREGSWFFGQIKGVSTRGVIQKIRVHLTHPLPDEMASETTPQKFQMRRWHDEAEPLIPGVDLDLEHGITVQFPQANYRTGDYWLIPLRSGVNTGDDISVPQVESTHTFNPLGLMTREGSQWEITDFRRIFLDLGDVFTRLEMLNAELERTKARLAALQVETDIEDEEQEGEISILQEEVTSLRTRVSQLPILSIEQYLGRYRSIEKLDVGDVVADSLTQDDHIIKASREAAPIGVVAPRPNDFDVDEYSVVLSGPVLCKVLGPVKAGDLLVASQEPGYLEKATFWERWFRRERLVARAIDNPAAPDDLLINVYFMPDYVKTEE